MMRSMAPNKKVLQGLEIEAAREIERKRKGRKTKPKRVAGGRGTRVAQPIIGTRSVHTRGETPVTKRKPTPVPESKSLKEIQALDPNDPGFKHKQGRPRNPKYDQDSVTLDFKDVIRQTKQESANRLRAKARKAEAVTSKALAVVAEERGQKRLIGMSQDGQPIEDEDRLIAEGVLDLEDWDDAELARGYRRGRNGRWGTPPKFIAREIQQEAFKRLVKRGERAMREAYLDIVKEQINIALNGESEKTRLEAGVKIQERLIGKVPDTIRVGVDNPWQDMLGDSLEAIEEPTVLDLEFNKDTGVATMLPGEE